MPILAPFEAFARDAQALNVEEDESRLPVRWLVAAQVAARLADATPGDMERGAALNLAYSTTTHTRIALMDRSPARERGWATVQQARIPRRMELFEEAAETYGEAFEDAARAQDQETERVIREALTDQSVPASARPCLAAESR